MHLRQDTVVNCLVSMTLAKNGNFERHLGRLLVASLRKKHEKSETRFYRQMIANLD